MLHQAIRVLPDATRMAHEAARQVTLAARQAVEARGEFTIGLSGGSTPRGLYELLSADPYASAIEWPRVQVYFTDERCVPPDDPESNYRLARESLLDHVPLPSRNVHRLRGEEDPESAAREYAWLLESRFGEGGLDLALLGMGEDGHTASLFPGTAALEEPQRRCVAHHVPALGAWRLTMTPVFLNRSGEVVVLVCGRDKAARVQQALEGGSDVDPLPIQRIRPRDGQVLWLMDAAAAGMEA